MKIIIEINSQSEEGEAIKTLERLQQSALALCCEGIVIRRSQSYIQQIISEKQKPVTKTEIMRKIAAEKGIECEEIVLSHIF